MGCICSQDAYDMHIRYRPHYTYGYNTNRCLFYTNMYLHVSAENCNLPQGATNIEDMRACYTGCPIQIIAP